MITIEFTPEELELYKLELVEHVKQSIQKAMEHRSNIDTDVLKLPGMSSDKTRHFFNNLMSRSGTRYLEIGMWRGSTFSASVSNNSNIVRAVGIDNWSQSYWFENNDSTRRQDCIDNVTKFVPENVNATIIDADCFSVEMDEFDTTFDVYFYDGPHDSASQMMALFHFYPVLDDVFVFIVDDYNPYSGAEVIRGTQDAIKHVDATKLFEIELPVTKNMDTENWWNGLYVVVLAKRSVA